MAQQNNIYSVAICDDEQQDAAYLNELVHKILQDKNIENTVFCCSSGRELLKALQNGKVFDLLLLDVLMPQQDGMQLAACLRANSYEYDIIFISVNREMALQGYEVEAKRYLAKPVKEEQLREALMYCYDNKQKKEFMIPVKGGIRKVCYDDIKYVETQGRGCKVVLKAEEISTNQIISQIQLMFAGNSFSRCHQGFIVNFRFVQELKAFEFVLNDGEHIPISKHRIKQVRNEFLSYLSD